MAIKYASVPSGWLAPGASGYASLVFPGADRSRLPPVDDHAVEPETREELLDGRRVYAAPASAPHADRHAELDYVLRASVSPGYVASTDLLTRTSARWNFAADASIRKAGIDPATGRRYLEELAFEIKHTQSMKDVTERARQLVGRGVRRVFVICVAAGDRGGEQATRAGPVMEWSASDDCWLTLDSDARIIDPCLRCPIQIRALLDAVEADNAVARALLMQGNPVLQEALARHGLLEAISAQCALLGIELTSPRRARMEALDIAGLRGLRAHIERRRCWDE